jgi:hypothetical protein
MPTQVELNRKVILDSQLFENVERNEIMDFILSQVRYAQENPSSYSRMYHRHYKTLSQDREIK